MPVRVQRLDQPPYRCAFTLRDRDPEGFYVGETLSGWDPKAAISASFARSLARDLGYVHPDDHQEAVKALEGALQDNVALQTELEAAEARLAAIDVIESAGFTARKKPGRPAQVKEKV